MSGTTTEPIQTDNEKLFERFLRFGFISKGVVYCLLGLMAVLAAADLTRQKASKKEAVELIYAQPFGKVILAILALGLLAYVTLRLFQCFKDSDNRGDSLKGLLIRAGYGLSALVYLGLTTYVFKLMINGKDDGGESRQFVLSKILHHPAGRWIIGISALMIIGNGLYQIYKGVSKKFMRNIKLIRAELEFFFKNAGVMGYISRGIVLDIIGYLLIRAAITLNPSEAKGSDKAFDFLENNFGGFLMGVVALGLIAYGIFMFVKARYQRLNIDID
jgi:hypothetical protein